MRGFVLLAIFTISNCLDVYSTFEVSTDVPADFSGNPFNPKDLNAQALVYKLDVLEATIAGFYFQNFTRIRNDRGEEVDTAVGTPKILFRYTPSKVGDYRMDLTVNGVPKESHTFKVSSSSSSSSAAGFIRVGKNKQHFAFDSGATYFPVGENLAWTDAGGVFSFEDYMRNISKSGGNYIRVWLTDGWDDLFIETQLGNYSLSNSWHVDQVLQIAENYDIKVLMCTESFNLLCTSKTMACFWEQFVYNAANSGGFLNKPNEFFTDERAKEMYKQRLRYLVARYGHSTSVFAWEFFNEVDLIDDYDADAQSKWVAEMSEYVQSIDPYSHMISTSLTREDGKIYRLPGVSFSMVHTYGNHDTMDMADDTSYWTTRIREEYAKPSYVAETGESFPTDGYDPVGLGLHNSFWAAIATASSASAMMWWWDSWIERFNLYHHFHSVQPFVQNVDFVNYRWVGFGPLIGGCNDVSPSAEATCQNMKDQGMCLMQWMNLFCCRTCFGCSAACVGPKYTSWITIESGVRMLGSIGSDLVTGDNVTAVFWVHNINSTYTAQNASIPVEQRAVIRPIDDAVVTIDEGVFVWNKNGVYTATFYDTATGQATSSRDVECNNDKYNKNQSCVLTIPIPSFQGDIAMHLQAKSTQ